MEWIDFLNMFERDMCFGNDLRGAGSLMFPSSFELLEIIETGPLTHTHTHAHLQRLLERHSLPPEMVDENMRKLITVQLGQLEMNKDTQKGHCDL